MLRNKIRLGFLLAALVLLVVGMKPAIAQDDYGGGDVDYQEFYDELEPHGQWLDDPDHGYVWVPEAGDDFRPYYSNGHWAYTDYGNTWVSDYSWGWAPFHYGRWTYHNFYGWMWIPGNTWGPAWVSWRSGGGNYGWAPLGPGISINIAIGGYNCPNYWWNFAPQQRIFDRNWNRYSYGPRNNNTYINQTTIINNTYIVNRNTYLGGPRRDDLRQAVGRDVRPLSVNNVRGPQRAQVRGNRLNIYRPAVAASRGAATVRPRDYRQAERPIRGNTPSSAAGFGARPEARPARQDRAPALSPANDRPVARPVRDRGNINTNPDRQAAQPDIRANGRDDIRRDRSRWNASPAQDATPVPARDNRAVELPDRRDRWNAGPGQVRPQADPGRLQPAQPQRSFEPRRFEQPQPQRSFERPQRVQPQQAPRSFERPQRMEAPRAQPAPQRTFDQPRPQMQPQRVEAPRAVPQQQAPAQQMARPEGGGRFRR